MLIVFLENIYYFCGMNEITVVIVTKSKDLPPMRCNKFFHSEALFKMMENTPGQRPYMAIAFDGSHVAAHLLVMLRRRGSLIPPYLFTQARAYGEGEYEDGYDKEEIFGLMLRQMLKKLRRDLCLYIEFSDLGTKMFGYGKFRENGFFPVHWMEIHNSLHSMAPAKRLTYRTRQSIVKAKRAGLEATIAVTEKEYNDFFKIIKNYITFKIRRYIPDLHLFHELKANGCCKLFITKDNGKIISGCLCVYSDGNCYLWYMAAKRNFHRKRVNALTVWTAIQDAYENHYDHAYFMDVGLPFKRNHFREFILGFGGKPVGTYRWFRCSFKWINNLLSWIYRE